MKTDLIRKEDAIKAVFNWMDTHKKEVLHKQDVAEVIMPLPSAQKTGKWKLLHKGEKTSDYECTNCRGILMDVANDDLHGLQIYCGMCGARMECEEE